jgi:hypothetical protein
METLPSASVGLIAETEWRLAAPRFIVLRWLPGIFLLEVLGPINGLKSDERRKT